ncbi:hypothetical protein D3C81_2189430 [compost metagenome]
MHQSRGGVVQRHAFDAAVAGIHVNEATLQIVHAAFDDTHQVPIAALEAPMVAVRILDALDGQCRCA